MRRTKIVCTIGPASESPEMVRALLEAGMDVARLNFSHGTYEEHLNRIRTLRAAAAELDRNLGILLDIQGPKIRLGRMENPAGVYLEKGQRYILTTDECLGNETRCYVDYAGLPKDVKPGSTVYIDDGLIELVVREVKGNDVHCDVVVGGQITSRKGVSLPGVDVSLPPVTAEDIEHIRFGVEHGVDFIAASFVRRGDHVHTVREYIRQAGGSQLVIAKIESEAGLRHIDEIIAAADGVMVARGDLGVEIPPEEVPLAQKMLIRKCNEAGKPVITATQMLDSMIRNARPTRAEVTDVSNAIFEGTDCVMLSGETAMGKYPVKAVQVMDKIARRIEQVIDYHALLAEKLAITRTKVTEAICAAACQTTLDLNVNVILCSTRTGKTAREVSRYRPKAMILALCPDEEVVRQLTLTWGVYALKVNEADSIEEMIANAVSEAKARGLVSPGDITTIVAGVSVGKTGSTNLIQVHEVQ